jgi:hypothetical protein
MVMLEQTEVKKNQKVQTTGKKRKANPEGKVYLYFREKGYNVTLGRYIDTTTGVSDFFVENANEKFWVEVKTIGGTLSLEQLEWSANNPEKTLIAITDNGKSPIRFLEIKVSDSNA